MINRKESISVKFGYDNEARCDCVLYYSPATLETPEERDMMLEEKTLEVRRSYGKWFKPRNGWLREKLLERIWSD